MVIANQALNHQYMNVKKKLYSFNANIYLIKNASFYFLYVLAFLYYYGLMKAQTWAEASRRLMKTFIKVCWL